MGSAFAVVTLSNGIQVFPDSTVRNQFLDEMRLQHLFYPDFRIKMLGERHGFPVINLAPLLQAYAERNDVFLHGFENMVLGFGHWNREGHRAAGDAIAEWLIQAGTLSQAGGG